MAKKIKHNRQTRILSRRIQDLKEGIRRAKTEKTKETKEKQLKIQQEELLKVLEKRKQDLSIMSEINREKRKREPRILFKFTDEELIFWNSQGLVDSLIAQKFSCSTSAVFSRRKKLGIKSASLKGRRHHYSKSLLNKKKEDNFRTLTYTKEYNIKLKNNFKNMSEGELNKYIKLIRLDEFRRE